MSFKDKADKPEKDLVDLAAQGDKEAFELLMAKYQHRIAKVVSRYAANQSEISDISQEAFLKAYKGIHHFRGESSFYTWLYRIAVNTAKNNLTKRSARFVDIDVGTVDVQKMGYTDNKNQMSDYIAPEYALIKDELEDVINEAIEGLPEKLRTAFMLFENEGRSYEEISHIMNCPVGTVRSRLFRARKALEEKIAPGAGGPVKTNVDVNADDDFDRDHKSDFEVKP